jgi:hypothetical protein
VRADADRRAHSSRTDASEERLKREPVDLHTEGR